MDPLVVLAVQCTFSIVVFFLLAHWYVQPRLSKQSKFTILEVLLIIHVFRYLPLSLYMPGQVDDDFPLHIKGMVAHGDFISSVLAFVSLILVKIKSRHAVPFIWVFSCASIVDMVLALSFAMQAKVYALNLGVNYFTVSVYVPLLMVAQYLIVKIMFNRDLN
ncbi:MAG: hypothetical protein MUF42_17590 [Cytophagaceae bacterium]|jgi:hypothetical protein|nr:hypothetical protein [Cytophagaceae bacterium]